MVETCACLFYPKVWVPISLVAAAGLYTFWKTESHYLPPVRLLQLQSSPFTRNFSLEPFVPPEVIPDVASLWLSPLSH